MDISPSPTVGAPVTWVDTRLTARSPRIVMVINGEGDWTKDARLALHQLGKIWGGSDAAVVPHVGGTVSPALRRGVTAYDPDHIVALHEDPAALAAVESLQASSATFRQRWDEDGAWEYSVGRLFMAVNEGLSLARDPAGPEEDPTVFLSCPASWSGAVAVAVADKAGVYQQPDTSATSPELKEEEVDRLGAWLMGSSGTALPGDLIRWPGVPLSARTERLSTAHDISRIGLTDAYRRPLADGLLVFGDTAEDFALARLWRLVTGAAWWFPWAAADLAEDCRFHSQQALDASRLELHRRGRTVLVLGADDVIDSHDWPTPLASPGQPHLAPLRASEPGKLPWPETPARTLVVDDHFDVPAAVPVLQNSDGSRLFQTALPARPLTQPALAQRSDLQWYVDVSWDRQTTVAQHPLDARELLVAPGAVATVWARPSKAGLTYQSHRYGLHLRGTLAVNHLAHPRLVDVSLERWLSATLQMHGHVMRPSPAGQRSRLLKRLMGSRERYIEVFSGRLLPGLRHVTLARGRTDHHFSPGGGVCLSTGAVISWAGWTELNHPEDLRDKIDEACDSGLLRRGLVLRCRECSELQFRPLGQFSHHWECQRCSAPQPLSRSSWGPSGDEPTWFYDLHAAARQMLTENGEVVALTVAYLSHKIQQGMVRQSVDEFEILRNSKPIAEIDLLFHDRQLRIAECKSSVAHPPTVAEIKKKCDAVRLLRTDELIFSTTDAQWPPTFVKRLKATVGAFDWGDHAAPRLRLLSALSPALEGAADSYV